jgi:hypothetical protein
VHRLEPWLSAGYSYGSGDGNPSDSRHGTFFQLLTTPRLYARFPFYNMMNNEDFYGTLNVHPGRKLTLRSEAHALRLSADARLTVADAFAGKLVDAPYFSNYERWSMPWKLTVGEVDGQPVVIILQRGTDTWTPYSVVQFHVEGKQINRIRDYAHCPWLISIVDSVTIFSDRTGPRHWNASSLRTRRRACRKVCDVLNGVDLSEQR